MGNVSKLLEAAIESIIETKEEEDIDSFFFFRERLRFSPWDSPGWMILN